jgi:hypothetical protein
LKGYLLASAFLIASLFLFGCTGDMSIPGVPFTLSQWVNRATTFDYNLFQDGNYTNQVLFIDGNRISSTDFNGDFITGPPGATGATGATGPQGPQGPPGLDGNNAFDVNCPLGEVLRQVDSNGGFVCVTATSGGVDTNTQTAGWTNASGEWLRDLNSHGVSTLTLGGADILFQTGITSRVNTMRIQGYDNSIIAYGAIMPSGGVNIGSPGSAFGSIYANGFTQSGRSVCDTSGNCVYVGSDLTIAGNVYVDGNYLCDSTTCYKISDLNIVGSSSVDTNWQTSFSVFDANMKATYPIKSDVNTWGDARYLPIGTTFTDTNWQTSWSTFDANMKAQYRKYSVDLNTSANISADGNVSATYFKGNGSLLTGIVSGGASDGNVYSLGIMRSDSNRFNINIDINKADPEMRLTNTSSDYMRQLRTSTTNYGYQYNRILVPAGIIGKAVTATTINDYISVNDANAFSFGNGGTDTPFSISFWVYINTIHSTANILIAKHNTGQAEYDIGLYPSGKLFFVLDSNLSENYIGRRYNTALATGQWYHIVATYSGSKTTAGIKIYINDIRRDDTDNTSGSYVGMNNGTGKFIIGGREIKDYAAQATFDEVAIWNKELSQAEVDSLWNTGSGLCGNITTSPYNTNLVGAWHLDEGTGTTPQDFSGNAYHGSFVGSPTWATGKILLASLMGETTVWSSRDGALAGEKGIQTFGDVAGRTVIDGLTTRFNLAGVEKIQLASTGLNFIDSFPINLGDAQDATITYTGVDLNINPKSVGTGKVNINGNLSVDSNYMVGGINGLTKNMTIVKSVDLVGLTKVMCDLNFVGGILIGSTC